MSDRNFHDSVSGNNSMLPWGREAALENGYTRYMDRDGCPRCAKEKNYSGPVSRYLRDDSCTFCAAIDFGETVWLWRLGAPGRPEPWVTSLEDAKQQGVDWYYLNPVHSELCPNGPHLRKTSTINGRCLLCEDDAAYFRSLRKGPRAIARAAGAKYYMPKEPCAVCGKLAERHVVTNGCSGCHLEPSKIKAAVDGRQSPSQVFARENPEFVISRDVARGMGFTLFRTGEPCRRGHKGWRYVSTGNCIDCLT